jgi:drug/metabolite transporter (DMT)-like permease
MARTPPWAIALVALCTLMLAAGQVLMQMAVTSPQPFLEWMLYLSIVLYGGSGVLMVVALKHGDLSVLYPIVALGLVWVFLASIFLLHETIGARQVIGTAIVMGGVAIIGHRGSRR